MPVDNIDQFTNYPDLWWELGLDRTGDSLFLFYHKRRWDIQEFEKLQGWKRSPRIFLIDQEAIPDQINLCLDKNPRCYFWDSTMINHPRFFTYLWWFDNVKEINLHIGSRDKLIPPQEKNSDTAWDCLLGTPRAHRSLIRRLIETDRLQDYFLQGSNNSHHMTLHDDWLSGGDHENNSNFLIFQDKKTANVASFVPYDIYNRTWYSIVTETRINGTQFYTEKTAKPIFSGRVFVMFGPQYALACLRDLGYQTFGCVIDESYDSIADDQERWMTAWQQIKYLMFQNHRQIYHQCQPVLDHNFTVFMNTDWQKSMISQIKGIINGCFPSTV